LSLVQTGLSEGLYRLHALINVHQAADAYDLPVILCVFATDRLIRGLYRFPAQG